MLTKQELRKAGFKYTDVGDIRVTVRLHEQGMGGTVRAIDRSTKNAKCETQTLAPVSTFNNWVEEFKGE